jgi:ankyrin repeat protein
MRFQHCPPDVLHRCCLLAVLPWLSWPVLPADSPLRETMRRRTLLAAGATWSGWVVAQVPALVSAAEAGDMVTLQRLLDAGVPVDSRDAQGRTALLAATHADRVDAAQLLIERGADVNARDVMQDSPFLYAGAQGRLAILRLTLASGADLKSTNRYGGTALIPTAHYGHVEAVRELLKTRIDVDHVNRLGWTALLEAIILGDGGPAHTEIVRLLVAHGASVQLADAQGVRPLAHAEQRGHRTIVEILRRAGARP